MKNDSIAKRTALIGIYAALALILGYVESLIPLPVPVPGMKLGLSNLAVVIALYTMRKKDVFILVIIKVILTSLLFGTMMSFCFSLAGGLLSFAVMCPMRASGRFGIVTVSLTGGFVHNIGQLLVAAVLLSTPGIFAYFPFLSVCGVLTGALIGFLSMLILKHLPKHT